MCNKRQLLVKYCPVSFSVAVIDVYSKNLPLSFVVLLVLAVSTSVDKP